MRLLYLLNRTLLSPLEAIFTFLIFILTKESAATPLQLTLLACSKPTVSLVSAYVNQFLLGKPKLIKFFLLACNFIGFVPCLFFPLIENTWFFIASYALFMITVRASYPAWIEVLKSKLDLKKLTNTVACGSSINYCVLTFLPLIFTYFLDKNIGIWKFLFVGMAAMQFLSFFILLLSSFDLKSTTLDTEVVIRKNIFKEGLLILWKNPDFAKYQALFFLGGAGLVAIQPILPIYFNETLHLSYTQLALAFSVCRGIAFMSSTPVWIFYTSKLSLFSLNAFINVLSTLFIGFILIAQVGIEWLFAGYLMYGAMQSGCELSWNLSGPIFSKQNESIPYSSLNLCFVSLRGMIFPFLGQLIYYSSNSTVLFSLAGMTCLMSVFYGFALNHKYKGDFYTIGAA